MTSGYINTKALLDFHTEVLSEYDLPEHESRACTLLTFTREPTPDRYTTRIGGLAAWPASEPWPTCTECGERLAFAAQLDFRNDDSVHFDTLLFHYCFTCRPWEPSGSASISLRSIEPTINLIDEIVIPVSLEDDEPGPCFGVPFQLNDYPYDELCALATKIGGFRPEIQDRDTVADSSGVPMKYLACLGGVDGTELQKIAGTPAVGDLTWGDVGFVYFWHSAKLQEVSWTLDCY